MAGDEIEVTGIEFTAPAGGWKFDVYDLTAVANHANKPIVIDQDTLAIRADIDYLEEEGSKFKGRVARYQTFRDWYDGEHNVKLSDRQTEAFEASGIPWSDNFTDLVVDAVVRRLQLVGQ